MLVRPMPNGKYQIVAGERRWRASRMAGLTELPVIIRDLDEAAAMEVALIENLQRSDLNPMEEAMGYPVRQWHMPCVCWRCLRKLPAWYGTESSVRAMPGLCWACRKPV